MLTVAPADDLAAACRALFAHAPPGAADRFRVMVAAGDLDPAGLFVARDGDGVVGAMYSYLGDGGQAAAWPPAADDPAVADALVAAAVGWFRANAVAVAQAVVRRRDRPRAAALERAGFRPTTALTFQSRAVNRHGRDKLGRSPLLFRRVPGPTAELAALLLATYDGTLDCPELNGVRTGEQVLAGYAAAAADPPHWWVAEEAGRPVGVVFLAPRDDGACELTYLGLVPAARGRGLGRHLVRFAAQQAAAGGHLSLALSADVRNVPALRLYAADGFRETDRRDVYLLVLGPTPAEIPSRPPAG
jgi:ribosomal protein S18 acetylase RimI-like enzyme